MFYLFVLAGIRQCHTALQNIIHLIGHQSGTQKMKCCSSSPHSKRGSLCLDGPLVLYFFWPLFTAGLVVPQLILTRWGTKGEFYWKQHKIFCGNTCNFTATNHLAKCITLLCCNFYECVAEHHVANWNVSDKLDTTDERALCEIKRYK